MRRDLDPDARASPPRPHPGAVRSLRAQLGRGPGVWPGWAVAGCVGCPCRGVRPRACDDFVPYTGTKASHVFDGRRLRCGMRSKVVADLRAAGRGERSSGVVGVRGRDGAVAGGVGSSCRAVRPTSVTPLLRQAQQRSHTSAAANLNGTCVAVYATKAPLTFARMAETAPSEHRQHPPPPPPRPRVGKRGRKSADRPAALSAASGVVGVRGRAVRWRVVSVVLAVRFVRRPVTTSSRIPRQPRHTPSTGDDFAAVCAAKSSLTSARPAETTASKLRPPSPPPSPRPRAPE